MRKISKVAKILNFIFGLITVGVAASSAVVVYRAVKNTSGNVESDATIEIDGETHKTLEATLTGFYPGSSQDYTIVLTSETSESYETYLSFRDGSGELQNYIVVTVSTGTEEIEKPLSELLGGETLFLGENVSEIKITYTMPEEVGNEAQGTTADFRIDFSAKDTGNDDGE